MPKKGGKKKERESEPDSDGDIISRMKINFEDTKDITGVEWSWNARANKLQNYCKIGQQMGRIRFHFGGDHLKVLSFVYFVIFLM